MFEPQPGKSCAFYLSTTCLFDSSYLFDKAAQPSTTFFPVVTIGRRFCPGTRLKPLRHSQGQHQYFWTILSNILTKTCQYQLERCPWAVSKVLFFRTRPRWERGARIQFGLVHFGVLKGTRRFKMVQRVPEGCRTLKIRFWDNHEK